MRRASVGPASSVWHRGRCDHERSRSDLDHYTHPLEQQRLRNLFNFECELTKSPAAAPPWQAKDASKVIKNLDRYDVKE